MLILPSLIRMKYQICIIRKSATINWVAYKKQKFSPHSSGDQKSKIKVVMDLVHWWPLPFLTHRQLSYCYYSHGRRSETASWGLIYKGTNHLPEIPPPSTTILTPGRICWPGQGGAVAQASTVPTTLVTPKRILEAAGWAGWPHGHRFLHPSWEEASPWSSGVCWQCGAPLFSSEWDSYLEITKTTNDTKVIIKIFL